MSPSFSSISEANASEILEKLGEIYHMDGGYVMVVIGPQLFYALLLVY